MNEIQCRCGNTLHNKTDNMPFKARYIPDTLWDDFWDKIDFAIEHTPNDPVEKEIACMSLRYLNYFRSMFQCPVCGRFYIENEAGEIKAVEEADRDIFKFNMQPKSHEVNLRETRDKRKK